MTWMMKCCFITLAILFLWRLEGGVEACSCFPVHPQQAFCDSDVVIKAKVISRKEIDLYTVKYNIKVTKMFKGPNRNIDAVYTSANSAACGVNLNTGKQYLLTGRLQKDGTVRIVLCNFFVQWNDLSGAQKNNLMKYYELGCVCKITYCSFIKCLPSPAECQWNYNFEQTKDYACIKKRGSCFWYKSSTP